MTVSAALCVCGPLFLHCSFIFLHMKSAHFSWFLLFLSYPVLQADPALEQLNDDFPLVPV